MRKIIAADATVHTRVGAGSAQLLRVQAIYFVYVEVGHPGLGVHLHWGHVLLGGVRGVGVRDLERPSSLGVGDLQSLYCSGGYPPNEIRWKFSASTRRAGTP